MQKQPRKQSASIDNDRVYIDISGDLVKHAQKLRKQAIWPFGKKKKKKKEEEQEGGLTVHEFDFSKALDHVESDGSEGDELAREDTIKFLTEMYAEGLEGGHITPEDIRAQAAEKRSAVDGSMPTLSDEEREDLDLIDEFGHPGHTDGIRDPIPEWKLQQELDELDARQEEEEKEAEVAATPVGWGDRAVGAVAGGGIGALIAALRDKMRSEDDERESDILGSALAGGAIGGVLPDSLLLGRRWAYGDLRLDGKTVPTPFSHRQITDLFPAKHGSFKQSAEVDVETGAMVVTPEEAEIIRGKLPSSWLAALKGGLLGGALSGGGTALLNQGVGSETGYAAAAGGGISALLSGLAQRTYNEDVEESLEQALATKQAHGDGSFGGFGGGGQQPGQRPWDQDPGFTLPNPYKPRPGQPGLPDPDPGFTLPNRPQPWDQDPGFGRPGGGGWQKPWKNPILTPPGRQRPDNRPGGGGWNPQPYREPMDFDDPKWKGRFKDMQPQKPDNQYQLRNAEASQPNPKWNVTNKQAQEYGTGGRVYIDISAELVKHAQDMRKQAGWFYDPAVIGKALDTHQKRYNRNLFALLAAGGGSALLGGAISLYKAMKRPSIQELAGGSTSSALPMELSVPQRRKIIRRKPEEEDEDSRLDKAAEAEDTWLGSPHLWPAVVYPGVAALAAGGYLAGTTLGDYLAARRRKRLREEAVIDAQEDYEKAIAEQFSAGIAKAASSEKTIVLASSLDALYDDYTKIAQLTKKPSVPFGPNSKVQLPGWAKKWFTGGGLQDAAGQYIGLMALIATVTALGAGKMTYSYMRNKARRQSPLSEAMRRRKAEMARRRPQPIYFTPGEEVLYEEKEDDPIAVGI